MAARQGELLERPKRKTRGQLMHVCDARHDAIATVELECGKCGHRTEWIEFATVTEAKRGLPCPVCTLPSADRGSL